MENDQEYVFVPQAMNEEQLGYYRRIVNAAAARNMSLEEFMQESKYGQKLYQYLQEAGQE